MFYVPIKLVGKCFPNRETKEVFETLYETIQEHYYKMRNKIKQKMENLSFNDLLI